MNHLTLVGFCLTDTFIFFLELKYLQTLQDTEDSEKERYKEKCAMDCLFKQDFC